MNAPSALHAPIAQAIPRELRELRQWCFSTLLEVVKPGETNYVKAPLDPRTRRNASVTDPSTWGTFDEACQAAGPTGGVGFILTESDPFFCVDIDAKPGHTLAQQAEQKGIVDAYALAGAYVESSLRGHGCHVWARHQGAFSSVKASHLEIYSRAHYILCTGKSLANVGRPLPDLTDMITSLVGRFHVAPTGSEEGSAHDARFSDEDVLTRARSFANGEKFSRLFEGKWSGYLSQSEADFALFDLLCFAASGGRLHDAPINEDQVFRLFLSSGLAREKSRAKGYLPRMLAKYRAGVAAKRCTEAEAEQLDALGANMLAKQRALQATPGAPTVATVQPVPDAHPSVLSEFTHPPGLVGDVSRWIESAAFMPMRETAVVAALSWVAGVAGRSFNTHTGLGLALNLAIVAPTATGKEGLGDAHDALFAAVAKHVEGVYTFQGGHFASGQAFARIIAKTPCFVSVIDEFGVFIHRMTSGKPNDAQLAFLGMLLQISTKGGAGKRFQGTSFSDSKKDVGTVLSPNPTIVGSTTASTLFDKLAAAHVRNGLLPRFVIFEYKGRGAPERSGPPPHVPGGLCLRLAQLAGAVVTSEQNSAPPLAVPIDRAAREVLRAFKATVRAYEPDSLRWDLFTRAPANALKIATLLAIGKNPTGNPSMPTCEVGEPEMVWAIQTVQRCTEAVATRFEAGDTGSEDGAKIARVEAVIAGIRDKRVTLRVNVAAREVGIVTESCLWQNVKEKFDGKDKDFVGVIAGLIRRGILTEVNDPKTKASLSIRGNAYYMIGER